MFVKKAFILLFITNGIVDYGTSIGVAVPPKGSNITGNVSVTLPSSSTEHPGSTVESSSELPVTQVSLESTTPSPTHPEPVHINHNRTNAASVPTTLKPSSTLPTTKPSTTSLATTKLTTSQPTTKLTTSEPTTKTTTKVNVTVSTTSSPLVTNGSAKLPIEEKANHSKTTAAGFVALVCVSIVSIAFAALVAWRYVYRRRHGNREILINEEDVDCNDEDLRHFEATCIQLEPDA